MPPQDLSRRRILRAATLPLLACALGPTRVIAQKAYPSRPIRIVIGFPPGTSTDYWARILAEGLRHALGQPVIVDNKAGAHGQIGAAAVKSADDDGYTLFYASLGTAVINLALYGKQLKYDTLQDFEPVAGLERSTLYLAVRKDLQVSNIKELVSWAASQSRPMTYGSGGIGTTSHLVMELLKKSAGFPATHVPYKGAGGAVTDLIGGQIDMMFDTAPTLLPQWRGGTVKLIATTAGKRVAAAPQIATLKEQGIDMDVHIWSGLFAPKGTPAPIIARLNEAINSEMASGAFKTGMEKMGAEPFGGTAQQFRDWVAKEIPRWASIVQESGATPD
jgi:tripartite-type tricarboxylate transporter receptor subunit TctC